MNLARYRLQAAAQNRHRLWLCLAIAGIMHLGAIALIHRPTARTLSSPPIQFIAIDAPESSPIPSTLRAANAAAQTRSSHSIPLSADGITRSMTPQPDRAAKPATTKDKIWGDYLAALRRKIYREWQTSVAIDRPVKVRFAIDRQGRLMDLTLIQSCRDTIADQAALAAVEAAAPFAKLPIAAKEERLRVTFTFDEAVNGAVSR
jgi:periplasmic protein TonB